MEEGFDEGGACGCGASGSHGGKGLGDFDKSERSGVRERVRRGAGFEEVEGGGAEIAVAAVGGGEGCFGCSGDGEKSATEERAAGVELAGVGFGEGCTGKVERKEGGILGVRCGGVDRRDGLRDGGAFAEAAGGRGQFFGELGEAGERCHRRGLTHKDASSGRASGIGFSG